MEIKRISEISRAVCENVAKVIVGKNDIIELVSIALLAGGHVLLEDVPGTGKTVMAKSFAKSVSCDFKRIQFTPDLLPSDVTGSSVFNQQNGSFEFREGPVYTNILLADEINRATPRTQSALLECMEEKQSTSDGVTRVLPSPFFVLATQNPVEIQGTFPLPEAQLDRFLLKLGIGYPEGADAQTLIDRFIDNDPISEIAAVASAEDICDAQRSFSSVFVSGAVRLYITKIVEQTRKGDSVSLGVSPRGTLAMLRACQVAAAVAGRDYVLPDDVKRLAVPVFSHRIIMKSGIGFGSRNSEELIKRILNDIPTPTEDPNARAL
ncbi:MAG: MoxR family ATPase [Oscillospiraceae bacterium]|jgi:MoxR-like ATPase|nr:MoxR family ATPase [Oscillospiraceae bacterium]